MVCPYCKFDPILYIKSPELALDKVKFRLDDCKENSEMYLSSKNPIANLPRVKKKELSL